MHRHITGFGHALIAAFLLCTVATAALAQDAAMTAFDLSATVPTTPPSQPTIAADSNRRSLTLHNAGLDNLWYCIDFGAGCRPVANAPGSYVLMPGEKLFWPEGSAVANALWFVAVSSATPLSAYGTRR
jgi:hypothetical protein